MRVCALKDWATLMGVLSDQGTLKGENWTRTFQKENCGHTTQEMERNTSALPQLVPRLPVQREGETGASWNFHGCYDRTLIGVACEAMSKYLTTLSLFPLRCFPAPLPDMTYWACLNAWDASLNRSRLTGATTIFLVDWLTGQWLG